MITSFHLFLKFKSKKRRENIISDQIIKTFSFFLMNLSCLLKQCLKLFKNPLFFLSLSLSSKNKCLKTIKLKQRWLWWWWLTINVGFIFLNNFYAISLFSSFFLETKNLIDTFIKKKQNWNENIVIIVKCYKISQSIN